MVIAEVEVEVEVEAEVGVSRRGSAGAGCYTACAVWGMSLAIPPAPRSSGSGAWFGRAVFSLRSVGNS